MEELKARRAKATEKLFDELMFCNNIEDFLDINNNELKSLTMVEYLNELLELKNIKKNDVINASQLNTTYGYQIFSGQRKPSRNKLLQLIFGFGLNIEEAQRLLKIAGVNELYAKNKRDSIILFCINKRVDIFTADDLLFKFNQSTIVNDDNE